MTLTGQQFADSEETAPSGGHSVEASLESGDIITSDIKVRLEEQVEEAAFRQGMLNSAQLVGVAGLLMLTTIIVLLIEGLQNKALPPPL
jgi:hypothetical protein